MGKVGLGSGGAPRLRGHEARRGDGLRDLDTQELKGTFKEGRLDLAFPFTSAEAELRTTLTVSGTMTEEALAGTWSFAEYGGTSTATRQK